jgi:signal transduction histidine kinase
MATGIGDPAEVQALLHGLGGSTRVIRGHCHAIVRDAHRPDELIERLRNVDGELERLNRSVAAIQAMLSTPGRQASPGAVDLVEVVRVAVLRFEAVAREHGVEVRVASHGGARQVVAAHLQVIQAVIDALLGDAIVNASPGSVVTLAVTQRRARALVRIIDEGSVGVRSSVWAIAGRVVALYDGTFTDEPMHLGSCVRIEFPICRAPMARAA